MKLVIYTHFLYFDILLLEKCAFRARNILWKMMQTQTVLMIERGLIIFSYQTLRLYSTYNRKFLKGNPNSTYNRTVLIIERSEYEPIASKWIFFGQTFCCFQTLTIFKFFVTLLRFIMTLAIKWFKTLIKWLWRQWKLVEWSYLPQLTLTASP